MRQHPKAIECPRDQFTLPVSPLQSHRASERAEQVNSCEKLATRFRRSSSNICRHACFSQPHSPSMTQNLLLLKAETWDAVPKLRLYQYASVSGLLIWRHFGVGSRVSFSARSLSCFRPTFLSVRGIAQSVSRDHASGRGKGRDERSRFWAGKCRGLQLIFKVETLL